tara:strand:- start:2686 stop:2925 length:240 start_codon:yes stop_codon:yes gene_type:complete
MSVAQIPNLTAAISVNGSEQLEAVQAGSTVRITVNQIADFFYDGGAFTAFMVAWFAALPTTLPAPAGQPWNNGGVLSFS